MKELECKCLLLACMVATFLAFSEKGLSSALNVVAMVTLTLSCYFITQD